MTRVTWFDLDGGRVVGISRSRVTQTPRFLVLANAAPGVFRTTVCAGDYELGAVKVDFGLVDPALVSELETVLAQWEG